MSPHQEKPPNNYVPLLIFCFFCSARHREKDIEISPTLIGKASIYYCRSISFCLMYFDVLQLGI